MVISAPGTLQPEYAINGSWGQLFAPDGEYLAETQSVEATIRINRRDIPLAGTRRTGYKAMTVQGDGTVRLLKVSSKFLKIVSELMRGPDTQQQFVTSMRIRLDDPEAMGAEVLRLQGVRFWEINIGFNVNDILEESIPFTFDNFELELAIGGNVTDPASKRAQYVALT